MRFDNYKDGKRSPEYDQHAVYYEHPADSQILDYIPHNSKDQYTGLKDVDDIEIYEKDIIQDQRNMQVFLVGYYDGRYYAESKTGAWFPLSVTLKNSVKIGDFYNNKDLLEADNARD